MRQPKNPLLGEKLGNALTRSGSQLKSKRDANPELTARATGVRKRFGHKSDRHETATHIAVLEPPAEPEVPSPTSDEIAAALESLQTSHAYVEPTPITVTPPAPTVETSSEEPFSLSPFTPYLSVMIGRLKDARSIVAADIVTINKRLDKYRAVLTDAQRDVDSAEMSVLTLTDKLEKIDANIAQVNKLDMMSFDVADLIPKGSHHKVPTTTRAPYKSSRWSDDPGLCRRSDVMAFFEANSGNWSAKEVLAELPPNKRASAKLNLPGHLSNLTVEGKLVRVTTGVYTLAKAVETA